MVYVNLFCVILCSYLVGTAETTTGRVINGIAVVLNTSSVILHLAYK